MIIDHFKVLRVFFPRWELLIPVSQYTTFGYTYGLSEGPVSYKVKA
jgi:hypothetical protein